jgi:hypothetical protein
MLFSLLKGSISLKNPLVSYIHVRGLLLFLFPTKGDNFEIMIQAYRVPQNLGSVCGGAPFNENHTEIQ